MKYLSYVVFFLILGLLISCTSNRDLYISPNFISDKSLPAKPIFEDQNLDYFTFDTSSSIFQPNSLSLRNEHTALQRFNYQFSLPFYYTTYSFFSFHFYPEWFPMHYQSHFETLPFWSTSYDSFWKYPFTSYSGLGICPSVNNQRKTTYIKPSVSTPEEKSNVRYNLARTSNYNYTTRQRTKTSSGYYNDPKTIPSPVLQETQSYEYTPYTPASSTTYTPPRRSSSSTYIPKKPKPQATPASSKPSASPSNTYQQKPTAMPANTPL